MLIRLNADFEGMGAKPLYGAHTIEVNLEPSTIESEFAQKRYGKASLLVPSLVAELLV